MIPVEEVLRTQALAGCAMLARHLNPDAEPGQAIRSHGRGLMFAWNLFRARPYSWSTAIKRIVDQAARTYPLDRGIEAMHFFPQPCMFWVFEEPILQIAARRAGQPPLNIEGVLVSPWRRAAHEMTTDEAMQHVNNVCRWTPAEAGAWDAQLPAAVDGVEILGFSAFRTSQRMEYPLLTIPHVFHAGSRLFFPVLVKTVVFGRHPCDDVVSGDDDFERMLRACLDACVRWVLAATALIKQRILVPIRTPATRVERKRLEREELPTGIMTITLRATEREAQTSESRVMDWSHRWIVRGHWREQWYPREQGHRVIWIPNHIKGPADKPLVVRPAVYAVAR